MRITLVTMPWNDLNSPSLQVALLGTRVSACEGEHDVAEYHGTLRCAEYLTEVTGGEIGLDDYMHISLCGIWWGLGDWIFAGTLQGMQEWRANDYLEFLERNGYMAFKAREMRGLMPGYVGRAAEDILAGDPSVVAFTSTYQQNVASLALAQELKRRRPDVRIVFGGRNVEGAMGHAVYRNFPFVDYAVSGEGEYAWVALLDALDAGRTVESVPGLFWRDEAGEIRRNPPGPLVPITVVPKPDFGAWFEAIESSPLRAGLSPQLTYETSRGCWWGEKHHCTFCGLNGSLMTFRAKPAERVLEELTGFVRDHEVVDVQMVDDIMDRHYIKELFPMLAEADLDLKMFYEVKANLKPDELSALREGYVCSIQPGIESLSAHVLQLMEKGVHSTQNVALLRNCDDRQMTVQWQILYGFPGETDDDYRSMIAQLPALVHLQPPVIAVRIVLERFSPNFDRPEIGFVSRQAAEYYHYTYDLPSAELDDIAFEFETPPRGIGGELEAELHSAVRSWQKGYETSTLTYEQGSDDAVVIRDTRSGWPEGEYVLADPVHAQAYLLLLAAPRTLPALTRKLAEQGHDVDEAALRALVTELRAAGLVFEDGDRLVGLATRRVPVRQPPFQRPLSRPDTSVAGGSGVLHRRPLDFSPAAAAGRVDVPVDGLNALLAQAPLTKASPVTLRITGSLDAASLADVTGSALEAADVSTIELVDPVALTEDDPAVTLAALRLLREAAAYCIHVVWTCAGTGAAVDPGLLNHLPPPSFAPLDDPRIEEWRAAYRPKLFHYRQGLGFTVVRDRRAGRRCDRVVLRSRDLASFNQVQDVTDVTPACDLAALRANGLVLELGGRVVALPVRLRRWPIPAHDS